jgi:serine/threonine-protein kinase
MELIEGPSVYEMICEKPLAFNRAVNIFRECLVGLTCLHEQGYLHQDVKPENIMESEKGEIKLVDFGLAIEISATGTGEARRGTFGYSSPEQQSGKPLTPASDIFSLGVTFIDMLAGMDYVKREYRTPTEKKPDKEEDFITRRIKYLPDNVPREASPFILKTTDKDPSKRFRTCRETMAALNSLSTGEYSINT